MSLPLVRMLNVGGKQRPLVYVPVELGKDTTRDILVYLRDRSGSDSQLRIGTMTASEHFMINSNAENLLSSGAESFQDATKSDEPLIISPEEDITLDSFPLKAVASFTVSTPVSERWRALKLSGSG